ncbi:MAG: Uma2 family endonuclease [Halothece sp. Uz-M2-17]|nr:Uma2 family endonuclease [Halothece sp. Uz-M2-17]
MPPIQSPSHLSLQDFLKYPEIQPAREYIAGKLYQKPRLKGKQERVLNRLLDQINQTGKRQKTAVGFTDLRCTFENYSIVPDISVFNWNNLPVDKNGHLVRDRAFIPNWIIEFSSPEDNSTRIMNNILLCLKKGSQMGWLVDVHEQKVMTFPKGEQPDLKEKDDSLPIPAGLRTLSLSVSDLFNNFSLSRRGYF